MWEQEGEMKILGERINIFHSVKTYCAKCRTSTIITKFIKIFRCWGVILSHIPRTMAYNISSKLKIQHKWILNIFARIFCSVSVHWEVWLKTHRIYRSISSIFHALFAYPLMYFCELTKYMANGLCKKRSQDKEIKCVGNPTKICKYFTWLSKYLQVTYW